MKNIAIITLSIVLVSCGLFKKEPVKKVDESTLPVKERLNDNYYSQLKSCLTNPTAQGISSISKCFNGEYLLNVSDKDHSRKLKVETIIPLSYSETENEVKTIVLLNASDSLHLSLDYNNCINCPLAVKSFALYYQTSLFKTDVISGNGY